VFYVVSIVFVYCPFDVEMRNNLHTKWANKKLLISQLIYKHIIKRVHKADFNT